LKITGDYLFDAGQQDVWNALLDPVVLAAAMPGCEKLELVDGQYVGQLRIKVGPVQGNFAGKVTLQDKVEPKSYTMIVDGQGPPGFVKATAKVGLDPEGSKTRMRYDADAQVGGTIASVGQRLIDASSRALVKQSLEGLNENIRIRTAAKATAVGGAVPEVKLKQADAAGMAAGVAKEVAKSLVPRPVLVVIVVAAVALLAWLVLR